MNCGEPKGVPGLRPALRALQQEIREDLGEGILAYLDDVTILASPQRALHLVRRFESHLARHTRLRLNVAKTALWNEAGIAPGGLQGIQSDGRIWFGDQALEPSSRQAKQSRAEGVPLFDTFGLTDASGNRAL